MSEELISKLDNWEVLFLVGGAFKAGIFDLLSDGPLSAPEIETGLKGDQRAIIAVADALVEEGYLDKHEEKYHISDRARDIFVDSTSPIYSAGRIMLRYELVGRWLIIPELIKGEKTPQGFRSEEELKTFVAAMAQRPKESVREAVDICFEYVPNMKTLLDLGGGPGAHAVEFAARGIRVTVLDTPEVIDIVRPVLGMEKRIDLVVGDFLESVPQVPFDLIFMGNITHIYGPEDNKALFNRAGQSLGSDGYVAILDFVRGRSPYAPLFAVNMLVNTESGGTWTQEEYGEWLKEAGFQEIQIEDIEGKDVQLIFAKR